MKLKFKSCKIVEPKTTDDGIIEAFVSVFGNVDAYGEIIDYGAFKDSLAEKLPKGVWSHDWREPIAATLEAKEVPAGDPMLPESIKNFGGLYIKGKLVLAVQKAAEALELIKEKVIDEFSIGYMDEETYDAEDGRHLKKLRLFEWSPVLVGANPMTEVVSVKSVVPYADHGIAEEEADWDGPAQIKQCGDDFGKLKKICAWFDSENADTKAGYKLPHHRAADLKAVWKGTAAAMGALLGGRGGVDIPAGDKQGVYNHLAKHYKQFDKEVPEMKEYNDEAIAAIEKGEKPEPETPGDEKKAATQAVEIISKSNFETITEAIRTLTGALKASREADNQAGGTGRTPLVNEGGDKKIPVKLINQAIRELLKAKKSQ